MADVHVDNQRNANAGLGAAATDPLLNVRERLFHTLFYRLALVYARGCSRSMRRLLEMFFLAIAIFCFSLLVYIHLSFARQPVKCLEGVKDAWPRDGILRVEVMRRPYGSYGIEASYEKERRLQSLNRQQDEIPLFLGLLNVQFLLDSFFGADEKEEEQDDGSLLPSSGETVTNRLQPETNGGSEGGDEGIEGSSTPKTLARSGKTDDEESFDWWLNGTYHKPRSFQEELDALREEVAELQKVKSVVWPNDEYIVEYSLEYGFLRLTPATRQKLNLTVQLLVLDPATDPCFGDRFSQFTLQYFLGYDGVLMSSIKSLAEHEDNKGFLRNVVTGAHYHFVSRSTYPSSYVVAAMVMLLFTVVISMLLRYSQHQIFLFIVELLQILEFNTAISFPAAPLLTVILALVGMEAIMSEFFEDATTAFYVIVIVWIADQYDAICCHTNITKRYWLRFFYLYHFSFYAYHYRFSGQHSTLALVTMWLFTQHSMIYFFHHYELPVIIRQAQLQDFLMRNVDGGEPLLGAVRNARIVTAVNNNNDASNNNNVANPEAQRRPATRLTARRWRLGGFRIDFRFGLLVPSHRQRPEQPDAGGNRNPADSPAAGNESETSAAAATSVQSPSEPSSTGSASEQHSAETLRTTNVEGSGDSSQTPPSSNAADVSKLQSNDPEVDKRDDNLSTAGAPEDPVSSGGDAGEQSFNLDQETSCPSNSVFGTENDDGSSSPN